MTVQKPIAQDSGLKLLRDSGIGVIVGGYLGSTINNVLGNPLDDGAAAALGVSIMLFVWRLVRPYVKPVLSNMKVPGVS